MDLLIKTNEELSWYKDLSAKELSSLGFEMDNALQNESFLKYYNEKMNIYVLKDDTRTLLNASVDKETNVVHMILGKMNAPIPLHLKEDVEKMIEFVGAKIEKDSEVHYVDY